MLLVFVAGPRTNEEGIVPFELGMESFNRFAEESGSVCGKGGRILRAEEARRGVDIASRKRPRRKTRQTAPWSLVPDTALYAGTSIALYNTRYQIALSEYPNI